MNRPAYLTESEIRPFVGQRVVIVREHPGGGRATFDGLLRWMGSPMPYGGRELIPGALVTDRGDTGFDLSHVVSIEPARSET